MVTVDQGKTGPWRTFFSTALDSQIRIWIAIAAGCFTCLSGSLILLSLTVDRLKVSNYILGPVEFVSMLGMGGALGGSLSFAIKLDPLCANLDTKFSVDLAPFRILCPISKGYSIISGAGLLILTLTAFSACVSFSHHAQSQGSCSFEPTASALGMGHGYQAVAPPQPRSTIPTLYDPKKPVPVTLARPPQEDEVPFANKEADMGKRRSGLSDTSIESGTEISGPLSLEKPELVKQMRPARPWSEMPKKR